ncbi:MAG TPA: CsgG/HfaB family protein [Spirochaetota bacterium]|nr:CsgG/HfaB family protein [Spirochaetota bacterium]
MMKRILIFAMMMSYPATFLHAEKPVIAVVDFQPKNVSRIISIAVSDLVRSEMIKTGAFTMIERTQMDEILKEQGLQMSGCTDNSCAVKVGRLMSAKKILIGEVNGIGQTIVTTIRIVDVEKGTADFAATEKSPSIDDLDTAAKNITRELYANMQGGIALELEDLVITREGYYLRSIVPGWGQLYAGKRKHGYVAIGAAAGAGALFMYSYINYVNSKSDYEGLPARTDRGTFDDRYDRYADSYKLLNYSLLLLGAVYIGHWVDAYFFTRPDFDSAGKKVVRMDEVKDSINIVFDGKIVDDTAGRVERYLALSFDHRF